MDTELLENLIAVEKQREYAAYFTNYLVDTYRYGVYVTGCEELPEDVIVERHSPNTAGKYGHWLVEPVMDIKKAGWFWSSEPYKLIWAPKKVDIGVALAYFNNENYIVVRGSDIDNHFILGYHNDEYMNLLEYSMELRVSTMDSDINPERYRLVTWKNDVVAAGNTIEVLLQKAKKTLYRFIRIQRSPWERTSYLDLRTMEATDNPWGAVVPPW
jgi:hypothetical protein